MSFEFEKVYLDNCLIHFVLVGFVVAYLTHHFGIVISENYKESIVFFSFVHDAEFNIDGNIERK